MISFSGDKEDKQGGYGMTKVLVSACLMGKPVRYDGSAKSLVHPLLKRLMVEERIVVICPELSAGFSVPRSPAEISNREIGEAVLEGMAKVTEIDGSDVTDMFIAGAHAALKLAIENRCQFALLVDGSPSCGSHNIYDGTFSGRKHKGSGVTTALLRQNGIEVFAESQISTLEQRLYRKNA